MVFPFLLVYRAASLDTWDSHVALNLICRAPATRFRRFSFVGDFLQVRSTTFGSWQAAPGGA
jgi:hypothetical protein